MTPRHGVTQARRPTIRIGVADTGGSSMLTSIVERRTSLPGDLRLEILEVYSVAIGDRALQLSLALLEALPVAAATLDVSEPPRDA